MTIKKIDGVWAESGSLGTPPTAAKKAVGWVGDDQPYTERFNYLQNRVENAIDEIIGERVNSFYDGATDAEAQSMISTGLWDQSWGCTDDAQNLISGGSTKKYKDLATFFNSAGEPRLLVADDTNGKIEVWDPRTLAAASDYSTSGALTDDLPGGVVISIQSLCTDGVNVYATIKDTNASPDEYYIQAWNIETWNVKTDWPATGTQLTPTGDAKEFKAIIANATKIAVINNATTITASGDPVIEIVNISDGTFQATYPDGAGDAPTGVSAVADPCVASDGTNLFFGVYGGSQLYMCSATIADPATGCGGTNWGTTDGYNAHIGAIVSAGEKIVSFLNYTSKTADDYVIQAHTATNAEFEIIKRGQNAQTTPVNGSYYVYFNALDAMFDGINLWIVTDVYNQAPKEGAQLLKIDIGKIWFQISTHSQPNDERFIDDLEPSVFAIMPKTGQITPGTPQQGLTFDGRDVWVVTEQAASQTNSGKICRLPLALLRS